MSSRRLSFAIYLVASLIVIVSMIVSLWGVQKNHKVEIDIIGKSEAIEYYQNIAEEKDSTAKWMRRALTDNRDSKRRITKKYDSIQGALVNEHRRTEFLEKQVNKLRDSLITRFHYRSGRFDTD
jgi:CHASE3 domain sensor protein